MGRRSIYPSLTSDQQRVIDAARVVALARAGILEDGVSSYRSAVALLNTKGADSPDSRGGGGLTAADLVTDPIVVGAPPEPARPAPSLRMVNEIFGAKPKVEA